MNYDFKIIDYDFDKMVDNYEKAERIREMFKELSNALIVNAWNEYCKANRYDEDIIYPNNDETLNIFWGNASVMQILEDFLDSSAVGYGLYDDYVSIDADLTPTSFDDPMNAPSFDEDALADYMANYADLSEYFSDDALDYILGEETDDDDEE